MNHDPRSTWELYTATWRARSPQARLEDFRRCLSERCIYTDPSVRAVGHDELAAYMDGFQNQNPGGSFATRDFSHHHDCVLVAWEMLDGAGKTVGAGTSFGTLGADGRLTSMTGFFA
jgi:hypothetical protein